MGKSLDSCRSGLLTFLTQYGHWSAEWIDQPMARISSASVGRHCHFSALALPYSSSRVSLEVATAILSD